MGARLSALFRTTTFQLTLSYSLLFGISLSLLTLFFYWSTIGLLVRETDATLKAEITSIAEQYLEHGLDRLVKVIAHRIRTDDSGAMIYVIASRDYRSLAGNLKHWPQVQPDDDGWIEFARQRADGTAVTARARVYLLRDGLHLLVGRNISQIQQLRKTFNRAMLLALALTLVLAIGGGLLMSNRVLRRLSAFTATTADIVDGRLDRRLQLRGSGDEFDVLARDLNHMLDRLESLVGAVRHVSDNIAHDLRTPLTRLRNRIELLARRAPENLTADLDEAVSDADTLLSTFSALLRIARIESGSYVASFETVSMPTLLEDAAELYEGVAQDKDIVIIRDSDPGLQLQGDRHLLFQALANLLDNALKFAPPGSAVSIAAHGTDGAIELSVSDSGPGVPATQRERVTQRFARVDESRSLPGSGLGLSLVKAVVELHGGSLELADNQPGLKAVLSLPRSPGPAPGQANA